MLQTRRFRRLGENKERKVDVRILAAAQPQQVSLLNGASFRPDLYYRIAEVELRMPALREAPGDIPHIIRHLVYQQDNMTPAQQEEAIEYFQANQPVMQAYGWPGNVREMLSCVRRRCYLHEDVCRKLKAAAAPQAAHPAALPEIPTKESIVSLSELQDRYIRAVLDNRERLGLTQQEMAQRLGVSVNTLKSRMKTGPQ